ncbi:MAG TPA: hypothetical protein VK041_01985, partial [Opitutales bacterium]|nr:hypothetical protein [Opitutales bacterium]
IEKIEEAVGEETRSLHLLIPHSRYDLIARLHRNGCVLEQETHDDGVWLSVQVGPEIFPEIRDFVAKEPREAVAS